MSVLYIDVRDDGVRLRDNSHNPDKTQQIICKIDQNKWQKKTQKRKPK
jgi:predicted RNA-binding protein